MLKTKSEKFLKTRHSIIPKPSSSVRRILEISTYAKEDEIILDFFAGSGTTAQAVLELNAQDGGNRKFILVQLPEPTGAKIFPPSRTSPRSASAASSKNYPQPRRKNRTLTHRN